MNGKGEPEPFSLSFTVDVDVTDPAALRAYAVSRAESPEEITMADTSSMDALLIAYDSFYLDDVPGVTEGNYRTNIYPGHLVGPRDTAEPDRGDNQFTETRIRKSRFTFLEDTADGMLQVAKYVHGLRNEMQEAAERAAYWAGKSPDAPALTDRQAEILAGVLWQASVELIGDLFGDLDELRDGGTTVKDKGGKSWALHSLPAIYDDRYDRHFVESFLAICQDLSMMLVTGWRKPSCPAQDLAVACLQAQAEEHVLDTPIADELPRYWPDILTEMMPEGGDVGMLLVMTAEEFERENLPMESPVRFDNWFKPYTPDDPLPPYAMYWGHSAYEEDAPDQE